MTENWNWSWVDTLSETLSSSNSIDQSNGVFFTYRVATNGPIDPKSLNSSFTSISTNQSHQWRLWNYNTRPILDSLPAGARDTRWRSGSGLPPKIDALNYGLQGTTLFVLNDADAVKASGKYWDTTEERPITIAEAFENLWAALNDIEINQTITSGSGGSSFDPSALWYAIGTRYYNGTASAASSLDARTTVLENNINQLTNDIYGVSEGYTSWTWGSPLNYSIAQNIDYLLQIHNVSGWQDDPSGVTHGVYAPVSHTHPYDEVLPMPSITLTQARTTPYTSLENDILRLRYEIQRTRGSSSWYSDITDPVTSSYGNLGTHINYSGTGSVSSTNPHGISYTDIGVDVYLGYIANFIGMSNPTTSETPTYSSTNYITQSANLEYTIGELDAAIGNAIAGFVVRTEFGPYDRSGLSDTEREQTPIVIEHNFGEEPLVEVLDLSPDSQESWGMYTSPTTEVQIDHPDVNTIRIWTNAEIVKVVTLASNGGSGLPGNPTTTSHSSLDDLGNDDHLQYLLISGSRAMTGNLDMSAYQVRTTTGTLKFSDSYNASSTWTQPYVELASSIAEWSLFKTNYGEVSLLNAINQALGGAGSVTLEESAIAYGSATNMVTGNATYLSYDVSNKVFFIGDSALAGTVASTNDSLFVNGSFELEGTAYFSNLEAISLDINASTLCTLDSPSITITGSTVLNLEGGTTTINATSGDTSLLTDVGDVVLDSASDIFLTAAVSIGIVSNGGLISIDSSQAVNFVAGTYLTFDDQNRPGTSWSAAIPLSASVAEWNNLQTLIGGEGSIFAAIYAASQSGGGVSGLTENQILFGSVTGNIEQNSNFYFDDSNLYVLTCDIWSDSLQKDITTTSSEGENYHLLVRANVDTNDYAKLDLGYSSCTTQTTGVAIELEAYAEDNTYSAVYLNAVDSSSNFASIFLSSNNTGQIYIRSNSDDSTTGASLRMLGTGSWLAYAEGNITLDSDGGNIYATNSDIWAKSLQKTITSTTSSDFVYTKATIDTNDYAYIGAGYYYSPENGTVGDDARVHLSSYATTNTVASTLIESEFAGGGNTSILLYCNSTSGNITLTADNTITLSGTTIDFDDSNFSGLKFTEFTSRSSVTASSSAATIPFGTYDKCHLDCNEQASLTITLTQPATNTYSNKLLRIEQGSTTATTSITWATSGSAVIYWPDGTEPTIPSTLGSYWVVSFYWDGTNFFAFASSEMATA